jgi:hypothetical protein
LRKLYRRAKALSPRKYDFDACFADLHADMIRVDPYAYTNTNILRGYVLPVLHREHGLWTSYWNPLRALLADQNNPLSNFDLSTMILPHIIEHPCDPDSSDYDLNDDWFFLSWFSIIQL